MRGKCRQLQFSCFREFPSNVCLVPPERGEDTFDSSDELRLVIRQIVRLDGFVSKGNTLSRGFLVVDDHVLDILTGMDGEVLVTSPFERLVETAEDSVRGAGYVESLEALPLDIFDERGSGALSGFDSTDLELVFAGDFPEVLRQRPGVTLALGDERHPIIMCFVFEPNFDYLRNLARKRIEGLPAATAPDMDYAPYTSDLSIAPEVSDDSLVEDPQRSQDAVQEA